MPRLRPPDRDDVVHLPDGRRLAWASWGPDDGRPVLFSPGAGTGRLLGLADGVVERHGVRLVSYDRPGLGGSDPLRPRSFATTAADVAALAAALGLGRPVMVAHSQGAPFALAAAVHRAVSGLVLVAGADEVAHPPVRAQLPDAVAGLVDLAGTDPRAARTVLTRFDAPGLREMVLAGCDPADRAVYTDDGFLPAWIRATDDAFARGPDGYAADTLTAMRPWGLDLAAIDVPVTLRYGARDRGHSPDHGATLAARIPGATRHVVDDAGGALPWTHGDEILAELAGPA